MQAEHFEDFGGAGAVNTARIHTSSIRAGEAPAQAADQPPQEQEVPLPGDAGQQERQPQSRRGTGASYRNTGVFLSWFL